MEMNDKYITGETQSGFAFSILRKAMNNWELAEIWPEDTNNMTIKQVDQVMNMILGTDQYKKLREHCRDKDNIVESDAMIADITDIMNVIRVDEKSKN